MSGICSSDDPRGAVREYLMALNGEHMSSSNSSDLEAIDIQVNGKSTRLEHGMTVSEFLGQKGLHPNMVVVEHNGQILRKGEFADASISDGDVLEVVHFVGGG
jgi:thiamine biosynthesis protein ThiS